MYFVNPVTLGALTLPPNGKLFVAYVFYGNILAYQPSQSCFTKVDYEQSVVFKGQLKIKYSFLHNLAFKSIKSDTDFYLS
jgi:hypothetical protein